MVIILNKLKLNQFAFYNSSQIAKQFPECAHFIWLRIVFMHVRFLSVSYVGTINRVIK